MPPAEPVPSWPTCSPSTTAFTLRRTTSRGSPVHDAVAVAFVARPELVTTLRRNVVVETDSELCRGRTVVDLWRRTEREPNCAVGVDIDSEAFLELLVERLAGIR